MRRTNLSSGLLVFVLLLLHVVIWWVPIRRSLHFCEYTAGVYAGVADSNALGDLRYALWLRNAYFIAAGVSCAYAVFGGLSRSRRLLILCAAQWSLPAWLTWRQPEEVIVFIPSVAHFIASACALGFGGYLIYRAMTPVPDPEHLTLRFSGQVGRRNLL